MTLIKRRTDGELAERVARVESILDNLAPRTWVQEVLKPVEQSISRMEQTVSRLADESKILFSFHEQLLRERAEHERAESEARLLAIKEQHAQDMKAAIEAATKAEDRAEKASPLHFIEKKATPVLSFLGALFGVLAVVGGAFAWWIVNYVLPSVKPAGS